MHERIIKIILPEEFKDPALKLLEADKSVFYCLEESNSTNVVIRMLIASAALIEVMVAVALLPPLTVGALLLFITNII
jgi:uncharacterized membrane protein